MSSWSPTVARSYANLGEQAHVPILDEALRPLLGVVKGKTVLDFGCGDGRLACRIARHGPARIHCIDQGEELLSTAKREAESLSDAPPFTFERGDESILPTRDKFNVVLCSLMLMMCETRSRLTRTMHGLIGSISDGGRCLLVLTHPCFRDERHATFHNRLPPGFTYWSSGAAYDVILDPEEQQVATTISDYHWTLTDYSEAVAGAGGVIRGMAEVPGQYNDTGQPVGEPAYLVMLVVRA